MPSGRCPWSCRWSPRTAKLSTSLFAEYDWTMNSTKARCLILACGNTLREDDGVGPWLASWAEEYFCADSRIHVLSRHQWTPELAEDISRAESVVFIDCATNIPPGSVQVAPVLPSQETSGLG